jgi:hypothetical protein
MSDDAPVSWFLIEPGWLVESPSGEEIGRVEEVTGDQNHDIFDGLSVATGPVRPPHYVPAEEVAEILEGRVRLKLDLREVEALGEARTASDDSTPRRRRFLGWLGLAGRR